MEMKQLWVSLLLTLAPASHALEQQWHGLLDARLLHSDSEQGWLNEGLDKQRFDSDDSHLALGQAVLDHHLNITDTVNSHIWLNAYEHRDKGVGLGEAFLKWQPLPTSAWRWHSRVGLFFPELSLENTGLGWTSDYLISSSAINTWVGEELRTLGGEIGVHYDGARMGSPHDWRATAGTFRWNDPAGGLLAWRGWSVGDRVSASWERVPFPDLPIFKTNGYWEGQIQGIEPFREIDDKTGYYGSMSYGYLDTFSLSVMHYDNHGDPKGYAGGQWSWDTRFNHLGLRWHQDNTTVLAQIMDGQTIMGFVPFYDLVADFRSWYVLFNQQFGVHHFNIRYDKFWVHDLDGKKPDPNQEYGEALAVGWRWGFHKHMDLSTEWLRQTSDRDAREDLLQQEADVDEDLWQLRVRAWF